MMAWVATVGLALADPAVLAPAEATEAASTAVRRSTRVRVPTVTTLDAALGTAGGVQLHGAAAVACAAEPVRPGTLTDALVRAARQVDYVEYAEALSTTRTALAALPCLSGPLPGPTVARLAFLSGIVAYEEGEAAAAQASFRVARRVQPDLAWDAAFAPDARDLFEAAAPAAPTAPLVVFPARVPVWVDGAAWTPGTGIAPGAHILQLGLPEGTWTRAVEVPESGLQVVVGHLLRDADLAAVGQADGGAALARTLATTAPELPLVWFDEALWRWEDARWARHEPARIPRGLPVGLTVAGAATTLVGGPILASAWGQARQAWTEGTAAGDWPTYLDARARYRTATARMGWSRWVVAGGLGLVATGQVLGLQRRRAQLAPLVTQGGGGARLTVGAP